MRARTGDFWSGLAFGGLGAYIIFQASRWEYIGADGPGPGFFPLWYGIAMAGLSLALVCFSVRSADPERLDWGGAGRALATWAALVACVALLKVAGFFVCFPALTFFIVAVMYRRPLRVAVAVSAGATGAFYVVFPLALGVRLP